MRSCLCLAALCVVLLPSPSIRGAEPAGKSLEVELEDLRPGLIAVYRSLDDPTASLTRIDAKPAFRLGYSSLHPRLPAGRFEATWTGVLFLKEKAPVSFDALLCGELRVDIAGVTVLQGHGERETFRLGPKQPLDQPPGVYRITIHYRSSAGLPARMQIGWQGPSFSHEPLPAWQLRHLAIDVPKDLATEQRADQGRSAVIRLGCACCHGGAFPGIAEPPPGPSLADAGQRLGRTWLLQWLDDPAKVRKGSHMPALFSADRQGFVERWLIAGHILGPGTDAHETVAAPGDFRTGQRVFYSIGCTACHYIPDIDRAQQPDFDRHPLTDLTPRLPPEHLAAFLGNPQSRYPDGRMPRLPLTQDATRDVAAYLLMWAKAKPADSVAKPPTPEEINAALKRLKVRNVRAAVATLLVDKGCVRCHTGLGPVQPADVPLTAADNSKGCLSEKTLPRYTVDAATRQAIAAYRAMAGREKHPSPFASRQRLLERSGCVRCHQRDSDRPPPLEVASSTLGGSYLQLLPFQRTPRLTHLHQKYYRAYLVQAVREGVAGLRPAQYSFRMPAFGHDAEALLQALAEGDGELPAAPEPPPGHAADPTLGTLAGSTLVGFQGYACVSCHLWNGKALSEPDPGAVGTDLTRVTARIRRDWFDRFLEAPARAHPGTPMPGIFPKGKPATLASVLDGNPDKQRDALWSFFTLGKDAPSPKPPPPLPISAPEAGAPPLVAQVPIRLSDGTPIESIAVLFGSHDLFLYDIGAATLHSGFSGAQILRTAQGRMRWYSAAGTPIGNGFSATPALQLVGGAKPEAPTSAVLHGYDRLADGVRIRRQAQFASGTVEIDDTLRLVMAAGKRRLLRELRFTGVPNGRSLEVRSGAPVAIDVVATVGEVKGTLANGVFTAKLAPDAQRTAAATLRYDMPEAKPPPVVDRVHLADSGTIDGALERPGYRAIAYPRPKTISGEDRIMPGALAVNPKDGRVFVASLKTGELFVLRDPGDDGKSARFDDYGHGLFQDALSMLAEPDALYVLHRRNLTRITEPARDGIARRFDRVAALPHGVADTYDYGYGLVRDKRGAFVLTYAPYANKDMPGSGSAIRLLPGQAPREIAYGFRNPLGWCVGPDREIFFTDNQGEWVATNKLCHLAEGRFFGFPNPAQRQHAAKPMGPPTVWVPYGWARSINGVTYDNTSGKFGPFAGQFFLAELMFGGAIVRANVEKVNGVYQGACFPFWGKGLLGPLTLAFDPKGRLFVGSITEPGWMAQPDRGALFRIDFTGTVPFEMQSIHARPHGFRIVFTAPVAPETARSAAAFPIEHYRYEYTGAYGSPELDRTRLTVERIEVATDGRSVELFTAPLVRDRVYIFQPRGLRSAKGETLVHPLGAYTLNEVPAAK